MKYYSIFIKRENGAISDVTAVKEGFSIKAYIFNIIWVAYQRLWLSALLLTVLSMSVAILDSYELINHYVAFAIKITIPIFIAFNASGFIESGLKLRNYEFDGMILAESRDEALLRYLNESAQK